MPNNGIGLWFQWRGHLEWPRHLREEGGVTGSGLLRLRKLEVPDRQELEACPATSSFRVRRIQPGSFQFLQKLEVPDREELEASGFRAPKPGGPEYE